MRTGYRGFTVIELLIVMTVIGILVTLVIVSYNSMSLRTENTGRLTELERWEDLLEIYMGDYNKLPMTAQTVIDNGTNESTYCLGTGYPDTDYRPSGYNTGSCRTLFPCGAATTCADDYKRGHVEPTLNAELAKVDKLPTGPRSWPNGEGSLGIMLTFYTATKMNLSSFMGGQPGYSPCPDGFTVSNQWPSAADPRVYICDKDIDL